MTLESQQTIKYLPADNYISFLRRADDGKNGITHLAKVVWDDGVERDSWVKIYPNGKEKSIINELVSFLIGSSIGLPMPQRAGLLMLETKVLNDDLVDQLSQVDRYRGYTYAWVSQDLCGKNPRLELVNNPKNQNIIYQYLVKDLEDWEYLPTMIAFDDLILNTDRNMGNFIQLPNKEFFLIDHGEALGGQWNEEVFLNHDCDHEGKLDMIFYNCIYRKNKNYGLFQFENTLKSLEVAKKEHKSAFNRISNELRTNLIDMLGEESVKPVIKGLTPQPIYETIFSFLEKRAHSSKGFSERCNNIFAYHSIPVPLS